MVLTKFVSPLPIFVDKSDFQRNEIFLMLPGKKKMLIKSVRKNKNSKFLNNGILFAKIILARILFSR